MKPQKKTWADRRLARSKPLPIRRDRERIIGCALRRGDNVLGTENPFKSHSEIRRALGDSNPYDEKPSDVPLFFTSKHRLVGRIEASGIAVDAGQAKPLLRGRNILSSDIDKWGEWA